MSYVVHIWEEAAPADLNEADQLHERLAGTAAPANPKFAQLALALKKRFPAEVGGVGEVDESWVESPPDGRTDTRVYSMGLYEGGIEQLLPVLVDEAGALGLTVYDDQAATVWLPGGWLLDPAGRHHRQAGAANTAPEPLRHLTVAGLRDRFKAVVLPVLAKHRFKMLKNKNVVSFTRTCAWGEQCIHVGLQDHGGAIGLRFQADGRPKFPPRVVKVSYPGATFMFAAPVGCWAALARYRPAGSEGARQHPLDVQFMLNCFGVSATDDFLQLYAELVVTSLLPLMDACQDAHGLLDCVRHPQAHTAFVYPTSVSLALAHWAGATDFDALVSQLLAEPGQDMTTRRVVNEYVQQLKALPDLFGAYPRMD